VVPDADPDPGFARDAELYYEPSTRAGAHLPHAWLLRAGRPVSTLDLAGRGRFLVLTGIGGEDWVSAAQAIEGETGMEIATAIVGPDRDAEDPYGEWASLRDIDEAGCLLVRPDMQIGFRARHAAAGAQDAHAQLAAAFAHILGHQQKDQVDQAA
jgi:2,4-dichlorophenol 6-monooxygenase